MSISWTPENLNDYLDDRLGSTERRRLEALLADDALAAEALRELQQMRARFASLPRYRPDREFLHRVVANLPTRGASGGTAGSAASSQPVRLADHRAAARTGPSFGAWRAAAVAIAALAVCLLVLLTVRPWSRPAGLADASRAPEAAPPAAARPGPPADDVSPTAESGTGDSQTAESRSDGGRTAGGVDPKSIPDRRPLFRQPPGMDLADRDPGQSFGSDEMSPPTLADDAPMTDRGEGGGWGDQSVAGKDEAGASADAELAGQHRYDQIFLVETSAGRWEQFEEFLTGRDREVTEALSGNRFQYQAQDALIESSGEEAADSDRDARRPARQSESRPADGEIPAEPVAVRVYSVEGTPEEVDRILQLLGGEQKSMVSLAFGNADDAPAAPLPNRADGPDDAPTGSRPGVSGDAAMPDSEAAMGEAPSEGTPPADSDTVRQRGKGVPAPPPADALARERADFGARESAGGRAAPGHFPLRITELKPLDLAGTERALQATEPAAPGNAGETQREEAAPRRNAAGGDPGKRSDPSSDDLQPPRISCLVMVRIVEEAVPLPAAPQNPR